MSDIPAVVPAVLTEQSVIRAQRLRGGARTFGAIGLAAILLVAVITLAVMVGAAAIPARAVIALILHRLPLLAIDLDTTAQLIDAVVGDPAAFGATCAHERCNGVRTVGVIAHRSCEIPEDFNFMSVCCEVRHKGLHRDDSSMVAT